MNESSKRVRVAVVGCGYWGPNLIRNFATCPHTTLAAACDRDPKRLQNALRAFPAVEGIESFDELLRRDNVDAVAIATPVGLHGPLAMAAMRAGKHVLVEKPMASSVREAEEMMAVAQQTGRVLMVDHTFVYSSPVQKIKEILDSGEIGELYYIDSVRINLGLLQHDVNVIWDLAPHDLSIVDYLINRMPRSLSAFGTCHTDRTSGLEDVAYMNLDFGDGLLASFHVNWLSPVKVRHFMLGGAKKTIVFNHLETFEKVKVYDSGITIDQDTEQRRNLLISYRTGDIWSPHVDSSEPLQNMVTHFAECILEGKTPLTDGASGLRNVRILEAAQHSIKAQGGRITL